MLSEDQVSSSDPLTTVQCTHRGFQQLASNESRFARRGFHSFAKPNSFVYVSRIEMECILCLQERASKD